MLNTLKKYQVILASNSPRRKELLSGLGIDFEVRVIPHIDESYPKELELKKVPCYIAKKKADAYHAKDNELIITADTVVILHNSILEKPADRNHAIQMLQKLSGQIHDVITGVVISTSEKQIAFSVQSTVDFAELTNEEITYYVDTFRPFDKAGAYGIQEWIGYIGVKGINGSFYNVMGLPIQRLYQELKKSFG